MNKRRFTIEVWDNVSRQWRMDRANIGVYTKSRINLIMAHTRIEQRDNALLMRRVRDQFGNILAV